MASVILKKLQTAGITLLVVSLMVSLIPSKLVFAADPNQLFISPASSQMNIGTTFTVNIKSYVASGQSTSKLCGGVTYQTANNVCGSVTYPAGQLKIVANGISTNGTAYESPSISQGNGTIGFSSGVRTQTGSNIAQVFAVTFQAIGAGNATVGFGNGSQVNGATTLFKSGVYTITNPTPVQSSAPPKASSPAKPSPSPVTVVTTTPSPQPDTATEIEPQSSPDPTGVIDEVSVDPFYSTSTVSWRVNAPNPTATVTYGTKSTQLDKNATISKKQDGTFTATLTGLTPGVRYYFAIAASGDGGKAGNYSGTIITRGFPILLTITENNIAAKNAQVKIGSSFNRTASADGKVAAGLASGSYSGTITTDTASLTINLTVETKTLPADGKAPPSQTFSYNLTSSPLEQGPGSGFTILSFIGALLGGTVILGFGFFGFLIYRRRKFENFSTVGTTSTVVVDDGYTWHEQNNGTGAAVPTPTSEDTTESQPLPTYSAPQNNSVHLSESEPLDMFEQAAKFPLPEPHQSPTLDSKRDPEQTSNPPRSTMQ